MSASDPDQVFQAALAHHRAGRLREADALYRQVLAARPDHPEALHMLGFLAHQVGLNQAAVALLRRAIELNPRAPGCHAHLAVALLSEGRVDEAIAALRQAIVLQPNDPELHFQLGNALQAGGTPEAAIEAYRQSLALRPGVAQVHSNLAAAYKQAGRLTDASAECGNALALKPDLVEAINILGGILQEQGKFDESVQKFREALAISPTFAEARTSLALALLLQGCFEEGWEAYESRVRVRRISRDRGFAQPYWDGTPLGGRRIMLVGEQGFGDTIQFVRYAPLVAARGGRVLLQAKPQLLRLLSGQCGVEQVFALDTPPPAFDVWCLLMSLPHLFGTTIHSVPAAVPYLAVDAELSRKWGERMSQEPAGLKVGLVWAGAAHHKNDHNRSLSLAAFAPAARIPGVHFYSLQKGAASAQSGNPPQGMRLVDWTQQLDDFADTAALVAHLDLVISVDTAVAHLAGAIGKPVWVLLPFAPDFRWLLNRSDSPWYPTMRLFRQPAPGNWDAVIDALTHELTAAAGRSQPTGFKS